MSLGETAFAKLNLALHVRARRVDGFHDIETLFAFANFGDRLTFWADPDLGLQISGPYAGGLDAGDGNLVLRAARLLQTHCRCRDGARIHLDKRLPVAAGIGGGSADAAAALRGLNRLWKLRLDRRELERLGAALGADVPACIASESCRGEGVGATLHPVDQAGLAGQAVLLANPNLSLGTAEVFAGWDGVDRGALGDGVAAALDNARNDLEAAACVLRPEIRTVLAALTACEGARLVRMSGSGATCFALFDDSAAQARAAEQLRARHDWWIGMGALR